MSNLVNLKNNDNINIVNKINNYNDPEKIYIPVKYLENNIKINEYIYKNTYFNDYICSISGTVDGIEKMIFNNKREECIIVKNDYKENIKNKNKKITVSDKGELIDLLNQFKLQKIKNKLIDIKKIKNLIISSIDEEFYSVKEFICLVNNYHEILDTIDFLIKIFNLNDSLLVTKNTDYKSIKNVKSIIGTYPNIKMTLAPDKYLIGNKEFLCNYLNINKDETLLLTTSEIYKIYKILNGKDINDTIITISGNAINKSIIVNVKLGISLKSLLNKYIKYSEKKYEIFINGMMQGYKFNIEEDAVIDDNVDYIVINKKEEKEVLACINCGACTKICPYNINVKKCYDNKLSHKKCIGCGLCNYICPVNINLKEIVKSDKY